MEMPASTMIKFRWNIPDVDEMDLFNEASGVAVGWLADVDGAGIGRRFSSEVFSTGGAGSACLETTTGSISAGLLSKTGGWESATEGVSGSPVGDTGS